MAMQVRNHRLLDLIAAALICIMLMSVSASEKSFALSRVTINGAGSTFVFPLLNTWRVAYQKDHPINLSEVAEESNNLLQRQ
jgi:ABC-type phosphate transport system substrate-binding protein